MRRIIDSDELRQQYDFKIFRGISYFLVGLAIARFQGYLFYIPGLWILVAAGWAVLLVMSAPLVLTAILNVQHSRQWYEGFDPNRLILLGCVAVIALTGIALELHRTGG